MREGQTDVLVVGAGPIGLWTALLLAEAGVQVSIIDREERTAARSYACALHPLTLHLLERFGLAKPLKELGRRVETVAFYDHQSRQAELRLDHPGGEGLVILPQDAFENALSQRLRQAGVTVHWNYRFDALDEQDDAVIATIEELGGTATGYIVPHWETIVKRRFPVEAKFLVGADGHNSLVRHRLGIEAERVAGPFFFAAYEFESEDKAGDEVRVVLDETTTNVLWPLPGNKYRWTFQLLHSEIPAEFPEKERRAVRVSESTVDERIRDYVQQVAKHRAPWFSSEVKQITWCTQVFFRQEAAKSFGRQRCWLAGDAAHQTGPVGVQSMNAGFCEAETLAGAIQEVLNEKTPLESLRAYSEEHREKWRRLLGLTGGLKPRPETASWVRERRNRLLPCLPATGQELVSLAGELKLDLG